MFKQFYGFTKEPFTRDIPVGELYQTRSLRETVERLLYAGNRNWFSVLTGEPGCGKTTMLRLFASSLDDNCRPLYVSDSKLTPRHFYKGLLEQLGCEAMFYRGDAKRQLHREIALLCASHQQRPVVIVDEAHLLSREMLEEVRFLLNVEMDSKSPMALVLSGQNELKDRLGLQVNTAIRQRIDMVCQAPYMDRNETEGYIRHHITRAGSAAEIFNSTAIDVIYRYSGGVARLVNKACTHSLLYGAQSMSRLIDDHMVARVLEVEVV